MSEHGRRVDDNIIIKMESKVCNVYYWMIKKCWRYVEMSLR